MTGRGGVTPTEIDHGSPPATGWASLVCELLVQNLEKSLPFWQEVLGFGCAYRRPEQKFVYLERPDGAQIMLCERAGNYETAELVEPFGRGVMFQVVVDAIEPIIERIHAHGHTLYAGPRKVWRRYGDREGGRREILIQDPDGYLVLLAEVLGERPVTSSN